MSVLFAGKRSRSLWESIGERGLVWVELDDVDTLGGRVSSLDYHRVVGRSRLARERCWTRRRGWTLVEGARRAVCLSVVGRVHRLTVVARALRLISILVLVLVLALVLVVRTGIVARRNVCASIVLIALILVVSALSLVLSLCLVVRARVVSSRLLHVPVAVVLVVRGLGVVVLGRVLVVDRVEGAGRRGTSAIGVGEARNRAKGLVAAVAIVSSAVRRHGSGLTGLHAREREASRGKAGDVGAHERSRGVHHEGVAGVGHKVVCGVHDERVCGVGSRRRRE